MCRPLRPPVRAKSSVGLASVARASTSDTSESQRGRIAAGSGPIPALAIIEVTSSASNISLVNRHRSSTPLWTRS